MKLTAVNVGQPKIIFHKGRQVKTSIFKNSVDGHVLIGELGLEGDTVSEPRYHGGVSKSVYAYPWEHYEFWSNKLGRKDLKPGVFGENLTWSGVREDQIYIGSRFQIGEAVLEVTQPRVPCYKLGVAMNDQRFVKRFLQQGYTGFYLRVIQTGSIRAGDEIRVLDHPHSRFTVRDIWFLVYFDPRNGQDVEEALKLPYLDAEWREPLEKRLASMGKTPITDF